MSDTPESLAAELDAMDAADAGGAAEVEAGEATVADVDAAAVPPRGTPDIDNLLEEAAAATSRAKERERAAAEKDTRAQALLEKYKGLDEAKTKGDIKTFVKLAKADGWTTQQIIEELALSEEFEGSAEAAPPPAAPTLEEQVAKILEDREKKEKETKQQVNVAERERLRQEFTKASFDSFKANKDKFPTTRRWAKKVTPALINETFREVIHANPDAPAPSPETIWEHIEAKFNAEIEQARPTQQPASTRSTLDDVLAELDDEDRAAAPPAPALMRKDTTIPIGRPVTPGNSNKTPLQEIEDELDRMDREANGRLRY
jgi:hypothetical protein